MKVQEVIAAICTYHPDIGEKGVDTIKYGDPESEVTGIVTTCAPTVEVIRKTAALGYNMIICHEPSFYTHEDYTDYLKGDPVFEEKCKLLKDSGITIWRDHDHLHRHNPDGIFYGVMLELGWEPYRIDKDSRPKFFEIPETTVRELAEFLKEKLDMETVRVVGNVNAKISRVAYIGGGSISTDSKYTELVINNNIDVYIAGEMLDWTVSYYIRDAAQLGKNKAFIQLGHFSSEQLGMKYYPKWLCRLIDKDIQIQFISSGDPYQYV